jgi:putative sterol carrier protein
MQPYVKGKGGKDTMARFDIPENIKVEDFYTNYLPKQFKELTSGVEMSAMAGKEFTLQFTIEGKKYCLKITNGKELEVIEGGIDKPMLTLSLSESDWRAAVTSRIEGILDRFTDTTQIADTARYNKLLSTKGTLNVELTKDDGTIMPIAMIFNGEEKPLVTIKLALSDWVAMQRGEVNGQVLFMSGKMKATGDMMFLMSLQQLI